MRLPARETEVYDPVPQELLQPDHTVLLQHLDLYAGAVLREPFDYARHPRACDGRVCAHLHPAALGAFDLRESLFQIVVLSDEFPDQRQHFPALCRQFDAFVGPEEQGKADLFLEAVHHVCDP